MYVRSQSVIWVAGLSFTYRCGQADDDTYKRTTCEAMIKLSLISDSDIKLLKFDCENKLQQHAIAAT